MDPRKVLYLIDGSSYIYRAFYAIAHLSNSKGMPTQAIYGFVQMVNKVLEEQEPQYLALIFDAKGPTFRHEIFPEYKANRPPMPEALQVQIPYIKEVSRGYGFPILEKEGLEADDLIGTLALEAEKKGFEVVIVSGDKDLMQLISKKVWMWDTLKDQVFDLKAVKERFGTTPDHIPDVLGLSGDSSDNIPGVPGIGEKTAVKLIQAHGSLDKLLENLPNVTPPKIREKITAFQEQARLSRRLATIDTGVPLDLSVEELKPGAADLEKLKALFTELEFKKFLDGLGQVAEVRDHPGTIGGFSTGKTWSGSFSKSRKPAGCPWTWKRPRRTRSGPRSWASPSPGKKGRGSTSLWAIPIWGPPTSCRGTGCWRTWPTSFKIPESKRSARISSMNGWSCAVTGWITGGSPSTPCWPPTCSTPAVGPTT